MPAYLDKTSLCDCCVSLAEVKILNLLLLLCAFNVSSVAVLVTYAGLLSVSSAAILCIFSFFLSSFLLDTRALISEIRLHIRSMGPIEMILGFLHLPQVVSLLWLLFLLDFARCPGQPVQPNFASAISSSCFLYIVPIGLISYVSISKLYFNNFLLGCFQAFPHKIYHNNMLFLFLLSVQVFSHAVGYYPSGKFFNESVSYHDEFCTTHYLELVLDFFILFVLGFAHLKVNYYLNEGILAYFVHELCSFQFLRNTAEAMDLFDDEMKKNFEKWKASSCLLNRYNFGLMQAEAAGQRSIPPPEFLAEEEQTLLQSDRVHVRALRRLHFLAYGIICANQNDILEVSGASHSKLWWKARLIQRAKNKEPEEEGADETFLPSTIKLCHLLFAAGGAKSIERCRDCVPILGQTPARYIFMWSSLSDCISGKKSWTQEFSKGSLQRHSFFRRTYEISIFLKHYYEFVERREGFRRRSLVLLDDYRLMTSIAEALEKQPDSTFVVGFQVPEQTEGGIFCWKKKKKKIEKEKLIQGIRLAISKDKVPVITTATLVDEDLRNSEFAPLVVLVRRKKLEENKKWSLCKDCDLTFDLELESVEPEAAAEELRRLWEDVHQGHQWIPTQWLP